MTPFSRTTDRPALIGMVHLLPLPGGPTASPGLAAVLARAAADARALAEGGADAIIVENLGDAPFTAGAVEPYTVAALTRAALVIREQAPDLPLGINVLRNDARSAMAIATATEASFVRVNVLTGVMVTDQGMITGEARELLLDRRRLESSARIAADVLVKHAVPLGSPKLEDVARDTWHRGGADALIVSGSGTGQPLDPERIARIRAVLPQAPVWAGSGVTPDRVPPVDAAIVGTWLHEEANLTLPVDVRRVATMREALG
ncbi:MAG: BtpA/SgcQ family protein [Deltaproteobacteria bacterium]|nr:MAG: BtpA/SgcQ family protein [Deltaproteobacteria bacterium]